MKRLGYVAMFVGLATAVAAAGQITVAAASDLTFALSDIAARFEKQTGNTVKLSFGSSGNFFSQIDNGAPFDLFFSADIQYPAKLEAAGLAEPMQIYGAGRLVLWVPAGSAIDLPHLGMNALVDRSVRRIAIANPAHAPYGRAAVAALQTAKLYDRVRDRLVFGENISQAAQFVESGNAEIGILALSLVSAPAFKGKGTWWEVPAEAYPRVEQAAVTLKNAADRATAHAFLDYLRSPEGRQILRNYGFLPPEKP